jgi:hypothetical protein
MALVSKLEDENRRLRDEVQHKNDFDDKSDLPSSTETISTKIFIVFFCEKFCFSIGITREEVQCIKNLTDENMKLKRNIKTKDKELTQKLFDMEAVNRKKFQLKKKNYSFAFRSKVNLNVFVN